MLNEHDLGKVVGYLRQPTYNTLTTGNIKLAGFSYMGRPLTLEEIEQVALEFEDQ